MVVGMYVHGQVGGRDKGCIRKAEVLMLHRPCHAWL